MIILKLIWSDKNENKQFVKEYQTPLLDSIYSNCNEFQSMLNVSVFSDFEGVIHLLAYICNFVPEVCVDYGLTAMGPWLNLFSLDICKIPDLQLYLQTSMQIRIPFSYQLLSL